MTTTPQAPRAVALRTLKAAVAACALLGLALDTTGAIMCGSAADAWLRPLFGPLAWTVPVDLACAFALLAALAAVAAYYGLGARVVLWGLRALSAASAALNGAAGGSTPARIGHGVLPLVALGCIELAVRGALLLYLTRPVPRPVSALLTPAASRRSKTRGVVNR
jgi:hypothetical protein